MFSKNALDTVTSLNGSHSTLENWKLQISTHSLSAEFTFHQGLPQTGQQQEAQSRPEILV